VASWPVGVFTENTGTDWTASIKGAMILPTAGWQWMKKKEASG